MLIPYSILKTPTVPAFSSAQQQTIEIATHLQLYHPNVQVHTPNVQVHTTNVPFITHIETQPHVGTTLIGYHPTIQLREVKHNTRKLGTIEAYGVTYRNLNTEVQNPHNLFIVYLELKQKQQIYPEEDPPSSHVAGKGKFNPLYKTELCRNWTEMGNCRYGRTCQFAHGRSEMRPGSRNCQSKSKICVAWLNGTCTFGSKCCYAREFSFPAKQTPNLNLQSSVS